MTRINPKLFDRLKSEIGKSPRRVYDLVEEKVRETKLPRHLAAIALASDYDINISRFATAEELAQIRQATSGLPSQPSMPAAATLSVRAPFRRAERKTQGRRTGGNTVFVVHGRNEKLRKALFSFLRAVGLRPLEWRRAIELTGRPAPYVGEILDAAFKRATAVVVLLTPDDEARLKAEFARANDPPYERELRGQPRPNVLFEAGMAFSRHQESTVLVQVGDVRPFSDIAGRHAVHLSNTVESRQELITKLRVCGCAVDDSGSDWVYEGDFGSS